MAKNQLKPGKEKGKTVAKFAEKRAALKAEGNYAALAALPRNASPVRLKNRCQLTGRPRGFMRHFGLSRVIFRDMALQGKIPGVTKASW